MKKILVAIGILISAIFLFGISLYAFFWFSVLQMYITKPIAKDVEVNSEWQKIEIKSPLQIKKQVQKISLKIDGYESKTTDNFFQPIRLKDGTILNPQIILVDENNKEYYLKDCCRTYKGSTTDSAEFSIDQKIARIEDLPKDVKYKAVMIKSDIPFKCDITWIDNDLM